MLEIISQINKVIEISVGQNQIVSTIATIELEPSDVVGINIQQSQNSQSVSNNITSSIIYHTIIGTVTLVNDLNVVNIDIIEGSYFLPSHHHTTDDITNFNSSVSGLLPTINNSGDNRILTSTGTSTGINAESNLTFDGRILSLNCTCASGDAGYYTYGDGRITNIRSFQWINETTPPRLIFQKNRGSKDTPLISQSGDGIFTIRGETLKYDNNNNLTASHNLGGIRMDIVNPASTGSEPTAKIYLQVNPSGDSGGEDTQQWKRLTVDPNGLILLTNIDTIRTTTANSDLKLEPSGTGRVKVSNSWYLPSSSGLLNQVLISDGSGNANWGSVSANINLNNIGDNRLLTSNGTVNSIDAESKLTFNGSLLSVDGSGVINSGLFVRTSFDNTANYSLFRVGSANTSNIVGGRNANVSGLYNFTGNGQNNIIGINNYAGTIINGLNNNIGGYSDFNTIVNGQSNAIYPTNTDYSHISNGTYNVIEHGTYNYIGNGAFNTINLGSNYVNILGGQSNSSNGYSNIFILGSNIIANQNDTTYVQNLKSNNSIVVKNIDITPIVKIKTSNQTSTINSLTNDSTLFFTAKSNSKYLVELYPIVEISGVSGQGEYVNAQMTGPIGCVFYGNWCSYDNGIISGPSNTNVSFVGNISKTSNGILITTPAPVKFIVSTSSTGGAIIFKFGRLNATTQSCKTLSGSWMVAKQIE